MMLLGMLFFANVYQELKIQLEQSVKRNKATCQYSRLFCSHSSGLCIMIRTAVPTASSRFRAS